MQTVLVEPAMNRIALLGGLGMLAVAQAALAADPTAAPPPAQVYVLPFRALTPAPSVAWVGRAVQQTIVGDVARDHVTASAGDGAGTGDTAADALSAARAAGARYVVTGTYQWSDPKIRLDGQLLDVATGTPIGGGMTATGDGRDVFALEDAVSAQVVRLLNHPPAGQAPAAAGRPVPPALQPAAVAAAIAPPAAGTGSNYQGSALQAYVDASKTPSVDYTQQVADVRDRSTFGSYNTTAGYGGYGNFGGVGYGGYGFGSTGSGGYLLGISYPVGTVGTYGVGGYGYTGFGGRGTFGGYGGFGGFGGFSASFGSGNFHGSVGYGGSLGGGRGGFR
jgi:TolB-like protein